MQFISQCRVGCDNYNSLGKAPNLRQCISAHAVHSSFHFFAATLQILLRLRRKRHFFIWIVSWILMQITKRGRGSRTRSAREEISVVWTSMTPKNVFLKNRRIRYLIFQNCNYRLCKTAESGRAISFKSFVISLRCGVLRHLVVRRRSWSK
jgi:hypothetical protein